MIALGSDHGGYALKQHVMAYLTEKGIPYRDFGCDSTDSCDYPDFGSAAARAVADGTCEKGIVICTTGIGISIAANKVKGVRCALCSDPLSAEMTRRHNDANMLAMGAGMVGPNLALRMVEVFLSTEFEGGRHQRRVDKITALEAECQQTKKLPEEIPPAIFLSVIRPSSCTGQYISNSARPRWR